MEDINYYITALRNHCQQTIEHYLPKPVFRGGTLENLQEDLAKVKDNVQIISDSITKEANRLWNEAKNNGVDVDALTEEFKVILPDEMKHLMY